MLFLFCYSLFFFGSIDECFIYYIFYSFNIYVSIYVFYLFVYCGYLFCVYCISVGVLFISYSFIGDYMFGCCRVCDLCLFFNVLVLDEAFRPSFFNFLL